MKIKLKKIAEIQMGYPFRSKLDKTEGGNIPVIQMKDLDSNIVNCQNLDKIDMDDLKKHHFVQKWDLIFRSRGQVSTSALLKDELKDAILAAPLLRIRISKPDKILPEYLNWFISQRDAQSYLRSRSEGTALKKISKKELEELEIVLPEIGKQDRIVELAKLIEKEKDLLKRISEKREQVFSAALMQFAKGE